MTLVCFPRFVEVQQKGVVTPKWGGYFSVRFFLCFPLSFKFLEKGVKGLTAGGQFSEIFLSEVMLRASLSGGQFLDTDTHINATSSLFSPYVGVQQLGVIAS